MRGEKGMKKNWLILIITVLYIGIAFNAYAYDSPSFSRSKNSSNNTSGSQIVPVPVTGTFYSSSVSNNYIATNTFSDTYGNYYNTNSVLSYIFSRSMCDVPLQTTLRGKSTSVVGSATRFHLANGQVWKQYVFFGGQVVDVASSSYRYTSYKTPHPKVKIYRKQNSYECNIMIDNEETGIMVYREF